MHKDVNRDMERVLNEANKIFKEMDKVFKQVESQMDGVSQESWESVNKRQKWEPYISWIPRKIGKRWFWHSPIYRKYQFDKGNGYWIYGTEFDVLKAS
jgi:hypothetical protein